VPPFHVKVIGAIAENDHVLNDDDDRDVPPLFSQTVTEYVVVVNLSYYSEVYTTRNVS